MKEATLENDILQYLWYMGFKAWPTHGPRNRPREKNITDVNALKGGHFYAIEVKKPGEGRTTKGQEEWMEDVRAHGGTAFVAESLADVQEAIK